MDELIAAACAIMAAKYADAEVLFLAGSLLRGEGTATSDLDLVVVYRQLPCARRESFRFGRWPVEAFIHDPATLHYFFNEIDAPSGIPSLPTMVREGIAIPAAGAFSESIKVQAEATLAAGPPAWSRVDVDGSRYLITGLADDLRDPRSRAEQVGTATALYGALANHFFRTRRLWSGKDKSVSRRLRQVDAAFAARFEGAFAQLFETGRADSALALTEEVLAPDGGLLFEGYVLPAPETWRHDPGG